MPPSRDYASNAYLWMLQTSKKEEDCKLILDLVVGERLSSIIDAIEFSCRTESSSLSYAFPVAAPSIALSINVK